MTTDLSALLARLAKPAQRALAGGGITSLEQLAEMTEGEIAALHGIGKNALAAIRAALEEAGLSLADSGK